MNLILENGLNKYCLLIDKEKFTKYLYFTNLFKYNKKNEITIHVSDVDTFAAVIESLQNDQVLPLTKNLIKCLDFFGINIDIKQLQNLDFETLVDAIDIIGYNDETIPLILKHLPENYDLAKFPVELLKEMLNLENDIFHIIVACAHRNRIAIIADKTIKSLYDDDTIVALQYSSNNEFITTATHNYIKIYDTSDYNLIKTFETDDITWDICISPDNKYIAAAGCCINIFNVDSGERVNFFSPKTPHLIRSICYSTSAKYIITGAFDKTIQIWDVALKTIVHTIHDEVRINYVCCSVDNQYIISENTWGND